MVNKCCTSFTTEYLIPVKSNTDDKYLNIDIYIVVLKNENGIAFNGNLSNISDQHAVGILNASRNLFYHERLV